MMMKGNGSKSSLNSLISSLGDSARELIKLRSTLRSKSNWTFVLLFLHFSAPLADFFIFFVLSFVVDGDVSITGLIAIIASFQSVELQIQAIKDLLRQRKEAIPNGKLSRYFYSFTLFDVEMTVSEIETLQRIISVRFLVNFILEIGFC